MSTIPSEWLHPKDLQEANKVQKLLAERVIQEDRFEEIKFIGGVDSSNNPRDPENLVYTTIVCLELPTLKMNEKSGHTEKANFPYVPGFLAFREVPALVQAFEKIKQKPDLIFVDGHGISHPRGLGIASHLGVILDCPTIGIAKKILVGKAEEELDPNAGDTVPLVWEGKTIGATLRTKAKTQPVYVSVGHKISLETAIKWTKKCLTGYRLPEPTRQAHLAANELRRSTLEDSVELKLF
ncbi:MAG: deoxyribonuclease V [Candidatus Caenarcaniphilales bacterium]|nr:deoxyribonuclease V [Candidatus Caenarcaniphilales bacterium]